MDQFLAGDTHRNYNSLRDNDPWRLTNRGSTHIFWFDSTSQQTVLLCHHLLVFDTPVVAPSLTLKLFHLSADHVSPNHHESATCVQSKFETLT